MHHEPKYGKKKLIKLIHPSKRAYQLSDEQRASIIGMWRCGVGRREISNITGYNIYAVKETIDNYLKNYKP